MKRLALLAALLGAAMLSGCGGNDAATTTPAAATTTIKIADFLFDPNPATVKVGQAIKVTNADSAPHTLTEEGDSPAFDSGTIRG